MIRSIAYRGMAKCDSPMHASENLAIPSCTMMVRLKPLDHCSIRVHDEYLAKLWQRPISSNRTTAAQPCARFSIHIPMIRLYSVLNVNSKNLHPNSEAFA